MALALPGCVLQAREGLRAGGPRCAPDGSGYSGEVIASVRGAGGFLEASLGSSLWAQVGTSLEGLSFFPRGSDLTDLCHLPPQLLPPVGAHPRGSEAAADTGLFLTPHRHCASGCDTPCTGSTRTELECQLGPRSPHSVSFPFPIHPWEASWPPRNMDSSGSQAPACLPTSQLPPQGLRCPVSPLSLCPFVSYCDWHSEEYWQALVLGAHRELLCSQTQ